MYRLLCDTHTHTLFSRHAYSSIEENVRAAAAQGLELLASTDHFGEMLYPEQDLKNFQYLNNYNDWPRRWHGVTLLHGCEADIVDLKGNLFGFDRPVPCSIVSEAYNREMSLLERVLIQQDFVIASIHGKNHTEGASRAQLTQMYVGALEHPRVLALGHIGRSNLDFEVDEVLKTAKALNKLIEINENSLKNTDTAKRCRAIAQRCAELEVSVCVNSDAHISCAIGRFERCQEMLSSIGFPEALIVTCDRTHFLEALNRSSVLTGSLEGREV